MTKPKKKTRKRVRQSPARFLLEGDANDSRAFFEKLDEFAKTIPRQRARDGVWTRYEIINLLREADLHISRLEQVLEGERHRGDILDAAYASAPLKQLDGLLEPQSSNELAQLVVILGRRHSGIQAVLCAQHEITCLPLRRGRWASESAGALLSLIHGIDPEAKVERLVDGLRTVHGHGPIR